MCALRGRQPGQTNVRAALRHSVPYKGLHPLRCHSSYPGALVPSRFMRKIVCRLRLNEVSRQLRRRPKPPPSASYSCISCSPTGCPLRGAASRRPASGRSYHRGMSPPPASVGGSHGSAAQSRCWYGCESNDRWENLSRSASPRCRPRPSWRPPSASWRVARQRQPSPSRGRLSCSPGRGSP